VPSDKPGPRKSSAEAAARAALARFRQQADEATQELLMNARPEQLTRPDQSSEIRKGNVLPASVWTFGPGRQLFTAQFDEQLTAIAKFMEVKLVDQKVAKLEAYFLGDTDLLVMYPALSTDTTAVQIRRYKNGAIRVNLSNLLIAQGVAVESNYKELRRVIMAPEDSPLGPALTVNYRLKPEERKKVPRSKGAAGA
jgi:hypothetical protein